MSRVSPTLEGFRAAFRQPSLTFAEITWRWTAGATACALSLFLLVEFLGTLPVNNGELLFLRTRQPILVGQAISHILHGHVDRALLAGLLALLILTFIWIVAASIGRKVTVQALLEYFAIRRDVVSNVALGPSAEIVNENAAASPGKFQSLLGLNFLRAAVVLAAILGLQGSAILAGFASPDANPRPGVAFFLFLPLAALVCLAAWNLNWFLSLAGLFAVRDGEDTLGSLASAASLCRERTGALLAVSSWSSIAHLVAFVGATTVMSFPLGLAPLVNARVVLAGLALLTLVYFAVADWLYMARLAGYVCIAEWPESVFAPSPPPAPLPVVLPVETTIDRDELILSDVPPLAGA
jgi:hypothetical protein